MNLTLSILFGGASGILFYAFKKWMKAHVKDSKKQKLITVAAAVIMLMILAVYCYLLQSI